MWHLLIHMQLAAPLFEAACPNIALSHHNKRKCPEILKRRPT